MRTLVLAAVIPLAAFACTVSANVGDLDRAPVDGGAETTEERDANGNDVDGAKTPQDAEDEPVLGAVDGGCGVVLPPAEKFLDIEVVNDRPPPNPMGGTIAPGVYELVALRYYFSGKSGTMAIRETMRVRGSASAGTFERLVEAKNASGSFKPFALHGETDTFEVQGPVLFVTPECPKEGFEDAREVGTSADALTIFDTSAGEERVYRRIE